MPRLVVYIVTTNYLASVEVVELQPHIHESLSIWVKAHAGSPYASLYFIYYGHMICSYALCTIENAMLVKL